MTSGGRWEIGECASVRIWGQCVPNLDAHLAGDTTRACLMLKQANLLTATSVSEKDVADGFGEYIDGCQEDHGNNSVTPGQVHSHVHSAAR